jgi:hypothetical protein
VSDDKNKNPIEDEEGTIEDVSEKEINKGGESIDNED